MNDIKLAYRIMGESCSFEDAKAMLEKTSKPIKYTYGLKFRGPTTCEVPISKERALELFGTMSDLTEYDDWIDLNNYGEMDLW